MFPAPGAAGDGGGQMAVFVVEGGRARLRRITVADRMLTFRRERDRAKAHAERDGLTGVLNRGGIEHRLDWALIGVTLVERTRRVVRFTPLGERVADKARRVLREAEELSDMARAAGQPLSGEMRMSVIPTIAPFMLPRILPRLRADYPDLKLYLREEPSAAACESLNHGRTDCVLLALPYACGDVETAPLFDDRLYLAYPRGEMEPAPRGIRPTDIDETRLLLLEDGHCLKDHALAACNRPEIRAEATMLGTSLHTIVQMVDSGLGMTMLPEMALGILDGTNVVACPLDADNPSRQIALAWRRASPREKDFRLLAAVLAKHSPAA